MSWTTLNRAQVFKPGSTLWALGPSAEHLIYKKLDWYLNFQLSRTHNHQPQALSTPLREIIIENQLPRFESPLKTQDSTLIHTQNLLPSEMVLLVANPSDKERWLQQLHGSWSKLKKPSLRVFLPSNISVEDFRTHWSSDSHHEISVYEMRGA